MITILKILLITSICGVINYYTLMLFVSKYLDHIIFGVTYILPFYLILLSIVVIFINKIIGYSNLVLMVVGSIGGMILSQVLFFIAILLTDREGSFIRLMQHDGWLLINYYIFLLSLVMAWGWLYVPVLLIVLKKTFGLKNNKRWFI